jgi:hypothetical protein
MAELKNEFEKNLFKDLLSQSALPCDPELEMSAFSKFELSSLLNRMIGLI